MLHLNDLHYTLPDNKKLLSGINMVVKPHDKVALIGANGSGKSTIVRLISGEIVAQEGKITCDTDPYIVPQIFDQFDHQTVAWAMRIDQKWEAFQSILAGATSEKYFEILDDDWNIEERCLQVLSNWELKNIGLEKKLGELSGGEKTKVFLAGLAVHHPQLIILDEPTNHLDHRAREKLREWLISTNVSVLLISHDRTLLEKVDQIAELGSRGIQWYGGNYDFYVAQKSAEQNALDQDISEKEKAIRKAKEVERLANQRKQKRDSRGKGKKAKEGISRIMMNTLRNKAEKSTAKLQNVQSEKIDQINESLQDLRSSRSKVGQMKVNFEDSSVHLGKVLINAKGVNYVLNEKPLWSRDIDIQVKSGDRMAFAGSNGAGKTTLVKILLGVLSAQNGTIERPQLSSVYIDQNYSLLDHHLTVYQQAEAFNSGELEEHEVKIRLNRFLFSSTEWDKRCGSLSGGERMRLALCCLTVSASAPDLIVLDEPTNYLDLENIEMLTAAIQEYQGTLLVISHDSFFLEEIGVTSTVDLDPLKSTSEMENS